MPPLRNDEENMKFEEQTKRLSPKQTANQNFSIIT